MDLSGDVENIDVDGIVVIAVTPKGVAFITLRSSELVCVCLNTRCILWRKPLESPSEGAPC